MMFLNVSKFCKQMKEAYNHGRLDIGYVEGGLFLCSGHWLVWIDAERVPNKIKAQVVELAGDLPRWDSVFTISKHSPDKQLKLLDSSYYCLLDRSKHAINKLIKTPLVLKKWNEIELYQALTGEITGIKSEYSCFIDPGEVDFSFEGAPTGPAYTGTPDQGIYWHNETGTVILYPCKISREDVLLDALELIQWREDGKIERRYTVKKEKIDQPEPREFEEYEQSEIKSETENDSEAEAGEGSEG